MSFLPHWRLNASGAPLPDGRRISAGLENRAHPNVVAFDAVKHGVGKATNHRATNIVENALVEFRQSGDAVENGLHLLFKLIAEAGPLIFVPIDCLVELSCAAR